MADLLPPVEAVLKADIAQFKKEMGEAKTEMSSVEKTGSGSFSKLSAGIAASMAVGVTAVAAFAVSSIGKFESVAGEVSKLSRLTGESAESSSKLRFEAEETGVSFETLSKGVVKMSKGIEGGNKAFTEHGIATRDAKGNLLSMNDIMANTAAVFAAMPNGIEKNALAVQLFGKSGTDMIPMLNKGKEGLQELSAEADKFGLTLGQKDVDAYKKNLVAHRQMHAAWEGLQVFIGAKLMPIIAKLTAWMAENLPKAIDFVKRGVQLLQPAFDAAIVVIDKMFKVIGEMIAWLMDHKDVLAAVAAVVGTVLVAAFISWAAAAGAAAIATIAANAPLILITAAVAAVAAGIIYAYEHFKAFRDTVQAVRDFIVNDLVPAFQTIWSFISDNIIPIIRTLVEIYIKSIVVQFKIVKAFITDVLIPVFQTIYTVFDTVGKGIATVVDNIVGFFTGLPSRIVDALSSLASLLLGVATSAVTGLWTGLQDAVSAGWNFITGLPGKFADEFGKIPDAIWKAFKAAWNAVADFFTFKIPQITIPMPPGIDDIHFGGGTISLLPHLAKGGRITESGLAVINENSSRGAETVYLPKGAEVVPNGPGGHTFNTYFNGITDIQALSVANSRNIGWLLRSGAKVAVG